MALSGSSGFNNYPNFGIQISWSASSDIGGNYSDVTATLSIKSNNSLSYFYIYDSTANISINGNNGSWSGKPTLGANGTIGIFTRTVRVPHDADGGKTFNISGGFHNGLTGSMSVSNNYSLDRIPRASSMSFPSVMEFGNAATLTVNSASTSFYHFIQFNMSGINTHILMSGASGGNNSVTIPLDFVKHVSSSSVRASFRLITSKSGSGWDNGNLIGFNDYTYDVRVPSNQVPTISSVTSIESDMSVSSYTGGKIFVQGRSRPKITTTASPPIGAKLTGYQLTISEQTYTSSDGVFTIDLRAIGSAAGTVPYTIKVTDSRGKSTSKTENLIVRAYTPPSLKNVGIARLTNPNTTIRVTKSVSVSPILNDKNVDINTYRVTIQIKETNASSFTNLKSEEGTSNPTLDFSSYSGGSSWDVRIILEDKFSTDTVQSTVPTMSVLLDLDRDIGIGIGKMHERGVLDVYGDFYHNGGNIYHEDQRIQQYELSESSTKRAILLPEGSDLNTAANYTGFFRGLKLVNGPVVPGMSLWVYVETVMHDQNYLTQTATDYNGYYKAFRVKSSNGWTDWQILAIEQRDAVFSNVRSTNVFVKTIPLKDGLTCTLTRSGNIVTASVIGNVNKTYSTSAGEPVLANAIPVGYRPTVAQTMILFPVIGNNTQYTWLSFLYFRADGGIGTGFFNTANPINFRGTLTYITTDGYPT